MIGSGLYVAKLSAVNLPPPIPITSTLMVSEKLGQDRERPRRMHSQVSEIRHTRHITIFPMLQALQLHFQSKTSCMNGKLS